ncbi:hypothetical protein ACFFJB_06625 [Camelimonas abortus]|uniref:Lipoprotein n=1 Tax=Camelimonas abortus TaxID=1017184 RepID=A0ABV7LG38_9HYPH
MAWSYGAKSFAGGVRMTLAAGAAAAAAVMLAACQTTPPPSTTDMLSAAGFTMKTADTPKQQKALAALPPNAFTVRHVKGKPVFIYADPQGCNCIYVGGEQNYQQYKALAVQKSIAQDRLMAAQLEQQAADIASLNAWDYATWGGWGGPGWWWW